MEGLSPKMQIFYAMTCYPAVKENVERMIEQLSTIYEVEALCTYGDWVDRHGLVQSFLSKVRTLPFAEAVAEKLSNRFKMVVA